MCNKVFKAVILLCVFIPRLLSQEVPDEDDMKISEPGRYEGYSQELYDAYERKSIYVEMRDGIQIALDIYRPQKDGIVEQKPLPVIWNHTQYTRALKGPGGNVLTLVSSPLGMTFIRHGYILIIVDARGTGASFGIQNGLFAQETTRDAYEITEWIASQAWCDGNIGMMGGSYEGVTQLMAASTKPPHLKAIFPAMFLFDLYDFPYHNGVFYDDMFISGRQTQIIQKDVNFIAPVDNDPDRALLKEATRSRSHNRNLYEIFAHLPFRNSFDSVTGTYPYQVWGPSNYINEINESGVAVYIYGGWMDLFPRDALLLYSNLTTPKKLLMLDTPHSSGKDPLLLVTYMTEQLRWFDYWLKGIPNGIMDEPSIYFQKVGVNLTEGLTSIDQWPPENIRKQLTYLKEGNEDSNTSLKIGYLDPQKPEHPNGKDIYQADYTTTSGTATRWDDAAIKQFGYPDMTENDGKGLMYDSSPLQRDQVICGHPVMNCWVSSTTGDFDLYVYLEDVNSSGISTYITEGCIRASHHKTSEAPYGNYGLPYHGSYVEVPEKITPEKIIELRLDLLPVYYVFKAGHRIRINITCADRDNTNTHKLMSVPEITLYRNSTYPSNIELPLFCSSDSELK